MSIGSGRASSRPAKRRKQAADTPSTPSHMPPPPPPAAAGHHYCRQGRRPPMAFLLLLMTALAATTFVVSTHAFLLPSPASAPATTTRAVVGPLFARYTSKDTGDRKKKNRARGFQAAKRRQQRGKGDGEGEEGGGAMFGDEGGSPDGDEEVLELSVDVEELLKFESALEAALKDVKKRGQPSKEEQQRPVNVILNATNMHWLLSQVAYDIGVRQFAVPGLGQMKDAAPLLPDDVEWILTSGLNEKSVRRIPVIDSLRAVYISTMEQALLLEEALQREGKRLAERPSFGGVSKSRAKFLEKQAAEKGGKKAAAANPLLKAVVLSPPASQRTMWSKEEVLALARGIEESCPRLVLWGLSLERCSSIADTAEEGAAVGAINTLRSMLGRDPVVILPMEGANDLAQAATATQSLAWASLATMLTVEAPDIEVGVAEGIQPDTGDEEEEGQEGERAYDPLAAEGDGLEEGEDGEVGLDYGGEVFAFDFEDEDDDDNMEEEEKMQQQPEEEEQPQVAERRQGPVSMGGGGSGRMVKKKKSEEEEEKDGGVGGAFGAGLDGKGW